MFVTQIPGTEGRAGMAAIHDPNGDLDLTELAKGIKEQLPSFARYLRETYFFRLPSIEALEMIRHRSDLNGGPIFACDIKIIFLQLIHDLFY